MTCTCGKPTRDDAYVCDTCLDDLAKALGDVPWVDEQLHITITKQRAAAPSDGARTTERPLPYHAPAVEKRDHLRHQLVMLVRFCAEEGIRSSDPREGLPEDDLVAMSRWLLWRVDGLAFNDMAAEWVTSVAAAVEACEKVVDRPPERQYAGPCSGCKRDLYAKPGASEVTCKPCAVVYEISDLHEWMTAQIYGRLVTASEGATLLSRFGMTTTPGAIRQWHDRGRLVGHGRDQKDRRLYLFDDLVALAARQTGRKGA